LSCVHSPALTVILLGFNNGRAGRMAPFAHARRDNGVQLVRRVARGPCLAAAAVRCCGKASGRHWCGGFPAGASRRFLLCTPSSSAAAACAVTRCPACGARRAPLKYVKEVLTKSDNIRCPSHNRRGFGWSGGLLPAPTLTMSGDNTCLRVPPDP
jgi:hypothetical protein